MPLPFFVSSSDGFVGGMSYTRVRGVALSGNLGSTYAGPIEGPGGHANVQPALICSTAGQRAQILSTVAASVGKASYVYITQTTGAIATSSFATGASAPPLTGMGAALLWDAGNNRLGVYSTVANGWMFSPASFDFNSTSTAAGNFTSS